MDQTTPEADWIPPTWDEIVRDHSARVFRLAFRLTGNRHDAEDLTQEVFVRVFRSLSTYRPGTFEGWLHRITTNVFLDQARRRQRIRFDALPEDFGDKLPGRIPAPDDTYLSELFDDDVEAALAQLKPEFRVAVVLCDIEGLSYDEIAACARRQDRHGSVPDPPRPVPAAQGAGAPGAERAAGRPTVVRWLPRVVRRQVRRDEPPSSEGVGSRRR